MIFRDAMFPTYASQWPVVTDYSEKQSTVTIRGQKQSWTSCKKELITKLRGFNTIEIIENLKILHEHGRPQNFFQGVQSRPFAYIFQVANADDQVRNQTGGTGQLPPRNCPVRYNNKLQSFCARTPENSPTRKCQLVALLWRCNANGR